MASRVVNLQKVEDSALETIQATDIPDAIATGTTMPFPQSS
jgi:hypothetical protein